MVVQMLRGVSGATKRQKTAPNHSPIRVHVDIVDARASGRAHAACARALDNGHARALRGPRGQHKASGVTVRIAQTAHAAAGNAGQASSELHCAVRELLRGNRDKNNGPAHMRGHASWHKCCPADDTGPATWPPSGRSNARRCPSSARVSSAGPCATGPCGPRSRRRGMQTRARAETPNL